MHVRVCRHVAHFPQYSGGPCRAGQCTCTRNHRTSQLGCCSGQSQNREGLVPSYHAPIVRSVTACCCIWPSAAAKNFWRGTTNTPTKPCQTKFSPLLSPSW